MEEQQIQKETGSIKLSKMSKGMNWEIKSYNDDLDKCRQEVVKQDQELRKIFSKEE